MELEDRLEVKAKAGVSNTSLVTPENLVAALMEADELIDDKIISDTVKLDIAYFRLMLMLKKDGVNELELEMYTKAMKIVDKASSSVEGEVIPSQTVKVKQRTSRWG